MNKETACNPLGRSNQYAYRAQRELNMDDPGNYDEYPPLIDIDFSRINVVFRQLVLFDDMFLNMQGMNVAIVDSLVTDQEYDLLREYFETERTPHNRRCSSQLSPKCGYLVCTNF